MKLKIWLLLSFFTLLFVRAQSQCACVVRCSEYNSYKKTIVKPVAFSLSFNSGKRINLVSNGNGVLMIDKKTYGKLKNQKVGSFNFLNPSDHEYYSQPFQMYNRPRKLSELCGMNLLVDRIW